MGGSAEESKNYTRDMQAHSLMSRFNGLVAVVVKSWCCSARDA